MERYSHCFYHDSVPHESDVICIFIEPLHLTPVSLNLVTVWYLNSSRASHPPVWVTCKYTNNADQDWVNHILHHDWPALTWLWNLVLVKTELGVKAWCWHSLTKCKNYFDKWTMMQICAFGDGDRWGSEVRGSYWLVFCRLFYQPPALKPFFHCEGVNCHFFQVSLHA